MQGQGAGTLDKERKIGSAVSIGMTVVNTLAKKHPWRQKLPYFHLDLNAGSGWNEIAGCPGSPVVFCELAQQLLTNVPLYAWFCDNKPDRIAILERWLTNYGHLPQNGISLCCEDNQSVIGRFAEQIRRRDRPAHALGSLLCDPNAWFHRNLKGEGVPVEEIVAFAHEFPKMDIILNANYRVYGMQRGAGHAVLTPDQIRVLLKRRHWLVSRQHLTGKDRFWLAIGRNIETRDHRSLGLYHWDSPEGRHIMSIVSGDPWDDLSEQQELYLPRPRKRRLPPSLPLLEQRGEVA